MYSLINRILFHQRLPPTPHIMTTPNKAKTPNDMQMQGMYNTITFHNNNPSQHYLTFIAVWGGGDQHFAAGKEDVKKGDIIVFVVHPRFFQPLSLLMMVFMLELLGDRSQDEDRRMNFYRGLYLTV